LLLISLTQTYHNEVSLISLYQSYNVFIIYVMSFYYILFYYFLHLFLFFFLLFFIFFFFFFFFSSRRRHTRLQGDWSSDVCSSDLGFIDYLRADANIQAMAGDPR